MPGNSSIMGALAVAAILAADSHAIKLKGKCPFGYGSTAQLAQEEETVDAKDINDLFNHSETVTAEDFSLDDYKNVAEAIVAGYEKQDPVVEANNNPRGNYVSCLLRTAGHDFMDYRIGEEHQGGSDGCIHFDDPDNAGIPQCLSGFGITSIYQEVSDRVSVADFLVIAAEAATARAATNHNSEDFFAEGTLARTFRDGFKFGRVTAQDCQWNVGRMPNPEHGCKGDGPGFDGLEQIFVDNIFAGRNDAWALTAAISGAHTVGSAHIEFSKYSGHWSDAENSGKFNNNYYKSIVEKGWGSELNVEGQGKNQWLRADIHRSPDHKEFMLNTDICLAYAQKTDTKECEKGFQTYSLPEWNTPVSDTRQKDDECMLNQMGYKELKADSVTYNGAGCCAWVKRDGFHAKQMSDTGIKDLREACDFDLIGKATFVDCDVRYGGEGPAYEDIMDFARDENIWLRKYVEAWHKATENGMTSLSWLNKEKGAARHDPTEAELVVCPERVTDCWRKKDYCWRIAGSLSLQKSNSKWGWACLNKNRLTSEQKHPGWTWADFQWINTMTLTNPTMSSTLGDWDASRALGRQNQFNTDRTPVTTPAAAKAAGLPYGMHCWKDDTIYQNSIAVTKEDDNDSWWKAEFKEGRQQIGSVEVWTVGSDDLSGVNRHAIEGATIYLKDGDNEEYACGEAIVTQDYNGRFIDGTEGRGVFNYFKDCPGLYATEVIIRKPSGHLGICDVKVSKDQEYPRYNQWNNEE